MATVQVRDANNTIQYIEVDGAGTSGDPYRLKGTNAAAVLAALQAIQTATGAGATQATLANLLTELQQKTEPANTQLVSAASLPLPTGASTEATQASVLSALTTVAPTVVPFLITSGQSLSAAVDLAGKSIARIHMPTTWTGANLTFQASLDNVTYRDVYNPDGTEYVVQASAGRCIVLPVGDFFGLRYLKIRSGTASVAVAQGADRTLDTVTRSI